MNNTTLFETCPDTGLQIDPAIYDAQAPAPGQKTQLARIRRTIRPIVAKFHRAKDLADKIGALNEGDAVYAIISGDFIAGDLIEAYLVKYNLRADEIILASYSYNQNMIDSLVNLRNAGYVGSIGMVVSDFFFSHERAGAVAYTIAKLAPLATVSEPFALAAAGSHLKVTLIKTQCGRHIVIHGSANLRSSRCVEQIMIECNQDLYEFNRTILAKVLTKYRAKHPAIKPADWYPQVLQDHRENSKGLRASALWDKLTENEGVSNG